MIGSFLKELDTKARQVGLYTAAEPIPGYEAEIGELRRYRKRADIDLVQMVTLAKGSRGLRWLPGPWMPDQNLGTTGSSVVRQYRFVRDKPSDLRQEFIEIDERVNPVLGQIGQYRTTLRRWRDRGRPTKMADARLSGKILLVAHSQWSSGSRVLKSLRSTSQGRSFADWLLSTYDYVVGFEHPTVSCTPASNAVDLQLELESGVDWDRTDRFDVIAHGRGGLVTRYLFEVLRPGFGPRKSVFLGTPLSGSGESYKSRLLDTLSYLTNIAYRCRDFDDVVSILDVVPKILSLYTTVTDHSLNLKEVGVATSMLIPGLSGSDQNSDGMDRLRMKCDSDRKNRIYSVCSDFRPDGRRWTFISDLGSPFDPSVPESGGDLLTALHRTKELTRKEVLPEENLLILQDESVTMFANYFKSGIVLSQVREWLENGGV